MRPISEDRINCVKKHLKDGLSIRKVVRKTGESHGTVQRIKKETNLTSENEKGGRPKSLSVREERYLVDAVTVKGKENAKQAQKAMENDLGKIVSANTVRNTLRQAGLVSFIKPKKPAISEKTAKIVRIGL